MLDGRVDFQAGVKRAVQVAASLDDRVAARRLMI